MRSILAQTLLIAAAMFAGFAFIGVVGNDIMGAELPLLPTMGLLLLLGMSTAVIVCSFVLRVMDR